MIQTTRNKISSCFPPSNTLTCFSSPAFAFCIKYERKTEFRKLSDSVRNHLNLIIKHSHQTNSINLNDPVSLQLHLDTRLFQLDCAIKISLWQV